MASVKADILFRCRLFSVLCLLLLPLSAWVRADEPLKVLFIGNSYTYVNDLPSLVVGLADAAGGRKIETGQYLPGGYTLEQHARDKKALEIIRERKWDVVVLQENSLQSTLNPESTHKYARFLDAEIKKQGAKTVLYLTWARQHIPQMQDGANPTTSPDYAKAMFQMSGAKNIDLEQWCSKHKRGLVGGIDGAYFDIAKELHAQVAPVGVAWKKALAADPTLVLHQPDKSHPSPKGSYLAACVFYATLFDKSPVGLPSELRKGTKVLMRLPLDEAKVLQEIAWQTVQSIRAQRPAGPAEAAARARQFLADLFDPGIGLLPEFRGSKTYWLYHDNYLAAKVLKKSHPLVAEKITKAIQSFGVTESGKIEIVFGEARNPLPFRHFQLNEVRRIGSKLIKTEVVTNHVIDGWEGYADLLFLAALAEKEPAKARQHFADGMAMWDGKGLNDRVVQKSGIYATYKLALALLAAARLEEHSNALAAVFERLLAQQGRDGGWITDYDKTGKPIGMANVETTSLAILAVEAASSPSSRARPVAARRE